jgi:hypothetical protein
MLSRTTALNKSSLVGKYKNKVPLDALGYFFRPGGRKAFFDKQVQGGSQQLARARFFAALTAGTGDSKGVGRVEDVHKSILMTDWLVIYRRLLGWSRFRVVKPW